MLPVEKILHREKCIEETNYHPLIKPSLYQADCGSLLTYLFFLITRKKAKIIWRIAIGVCLSVMIEMSKYKLSYRLFLYPSIHFTPLVLLGVAGAFSQHLWAKAGDTLDKLAVHHRAHI